VRQQIVQKTKPPVVDSIPRVDVLGKKGTHTGARVEFDGWPTWKTATNNALRREARVDATRAPRVHGSCLTCRIDTSLGWRTRLIQG